MNIQELTQQGTITGVDDSALGWFSSQLASKQPICVLARNHAHMHQLAGEIAYFNNKLKVVELPAWDVQPYDRLAPDAAIQTARVQAAQALRTQQMDVLVTTVNGLSLKLPPVAGESIELIPGREYPHQHLTKMLVDLGFIRTSTVTEPGEFTVRGSVIDIFPPEAEDPIRLDFFDNELESLRTFDAVSQRSLEAMGRLNLQPASEVILTPEKVRQFRQRYRSDFPKGVEDDLYAKVSEGMSHPLMMHYLPYFFEEGLLNPFDLLPEGTLIVAPDTVKNARETRQESITDAYETRLRLVVQEEGEELYRPIPPESMFLVEGDWLRTEQRFTWLHLAAFDEAKGHEDLQLTENYFGNNLKERLPRVTDKLRQARKQRQNVVLTARTQAGLTQLEKALNEGGADALNGVALEIAPLSKGFTTPNALYITEQDILGDRQGGSTAKRKNKRAGAAIANFADLVEGDFVVHEDHGVARFDGLVTMDATGTGQQQDYLKLSYAGNDRVYVPVELLHLISRYSSAEQGNTTLDKLGGAAWQARKARVKKDLLEMAGELMAIAAARQEMEKQGMPKPPGLYEDFGATFPYQLTSEQKAAIDDVLDDMASDEPMDRLVVGDVGFGKTEVALRAAMVAVGNNKQVAVIAPTTLLARQHVEVFTRRFAGFPVRIAQLSRLVSATQAKKNKEDMKEGKIDIIIGTHALLAKGIAFKDLGLLIIDEEQRFGVGHKEKLKALKANVDVLTLTATPIPRTLHMSMGGIKSMSAIHTPPVDRLAVRSYVLKFDGKVIRDAILREVHRGGQVFVVTPRVQDIPQLADTLKELAPEATYRTAHGQMPEKEMEEVMEAFYRGEFQVLISTTIVESGIDVPNANTLIINRADRFGLSQLHQLRGRVGRSNVRAYAYFLLPQGNVGELAERRLRILQRLQGLGVGFQLASFDMDLRGAGNLVGREQSGHLNDVGFELYAKLLAEAVADHKARKEGLEQTTTGQFTPVLNLGISYLIPENYVPDLETRMQLYRRLAHLQTQEDLAVFEEELIDRFGRLPDETKRLVQVLSIRNRCAALNISKLDSGPQGMVIQLYNNTFPYPEQLLGYVQSQAGVLTLNPDQSITFHRTWGQKAERRLKGISLILDELEALNPNQSEQAA